jgi:hypothetical protein
MKKICVPCVLCGVFSALVLSACASSSAPVASAGAPAWWHSSLTLENHSQTAVAHLFLTPYDHVAWGPDQLNNDVLLPQEAASLTGLDCATYDLRLVDEHGEECVVQDIDLCVEDAVWALTDDQLASCQGWGV